MRHVQDCAYIENCCSKTHNFAEKISVTKPAGAGALRSAGPTAAFTGSGKGASLMQAPALSLSSWWAALLRGAVTIGPVAAPLSFGAFWLVAQVAADSSAFGGAD
jgi:hypothetical protein